MEALGYLISCWLLADFLSGLIHWWEDRYARTEWFLIGDLVAKPNELHHTEPNAFLKGSYWHRNWTTVLAAFPFFAFTFPTIWCLVPLFASQANEIHGWSHQRCNWLIRAIQATGILQSPREHSAHHKAPYDCRYCVMSNWLNPFLDTFRFWTLLERAVAITLRVHPK